MSSVEGETFDDESQRQASVAANLCSQTYFNKLFKYLITVGRPPVITSAIFIRICILRLHIRTTTIFMNDVALDIPVRYENKESEHKT